MLFPKINTIYCAYVRKHSFSSQELHAEIFGYKGTRYLQLTLQRFRGKNITESKIEEDKEKESNNYGNQLTIDKCV